MPFIPSLQEHGQPVPSHIDQIRSMFGPAVAQSARLWRRAVDRRLHPFGLTEATWLPLLHLSRAREQMRQKDLAVSLSLDSSSVVRLIDELQAAGLVERREDTDRRAKVIRLTALGRSTVERVEVVSGEVRAEILAGLSDRDLETALRVLDHVCQALSPAAEESPE